MRIIIFIYALFVIMCGIFALAFTVFYNFINRNIYHISYSPKSENETEFGLRSLLILYPHAAIDTTKNPISEKMQKRNTRITVHQET